MNRSRIIVDPPSGWRYGFPCELPEGKDYKELLIEHKYPEGEIDFAMRHTRQWVETEND